MAACTRTLAPETGRPPMSLRFAITCTLSPTVARERSVASFTVLEPWDKSRATAQRMSCPQNR